MGNQNVISMSLWGDRSLYCDGALRNAEAVPQFFPGWTLRVYHDESVPDTIMYGLLRLGAKLVLRDPTVDALGMFWRFEPMWDDTVDRFIVRDSDSRLTKRDADAVKEWADSGRDIHIIRDCESHNVPVLGGTWGAIAGSVPQFRQAMRYWLLTQVKPNYKNPRGIYHGQDQMFLWNTVWPRIERGELSHMAHIRAEADMPVGSCLRFIGDEIDLPPLNGGVYVGQVC